MFQVQDEAHGRRKFVGRAKATVLDNKDPQKEGRLKLDHPILGVIEWIPYLQLGMIFDIPEPGDIVYVECDGGFEDYPIAFGKLISESGKTPLNEKFKRDKPTNRGFHTPLGHTLELDDGKPDDETGKGIRFTTSQGSLVSITEDSGEDDKITLSKPDGQIFEIDMTDDKISMKTKQGQLLELTSGVGTTISSASGDKVVMGSGTLTVSNADGDKVELAKGGAITVENTGGDKIELSSGTINVENAGGNKINMSATDIVAENAAGAKMTLGPTEASLLNAAGAGMKADATMVAIGGPSAELVDIVSTLLTELSTDVFAGFGAPAGKAALYAKLAIELSSIKGSL